MSIQIQSFRALRQTTFRFLSVALLGLSLHVATSPASADGRPLDAPRSAGTVGERWDGFAEVRGANASAATKALVASTNSQRRQVYQKRATSEGISIQEVGKIYASKIRTGAPKGTWSLSENGSWSQK